MMSRTQQRVTRRVRFQLSRSKGSECDFLVFSDDFAKRAQNLIIVSRACVIFGALAGESGGKSIFMVLRDAQNFFTVK